MEKLKKEDGRWLDARVRWAADPRMTFVDVGEMLGVSKQAVARHANRYGWAKGPDARAIAARAQVRADEMSAQGMAQDAEPGAPCDASVVASGPLLQRLSRTEIPADASSEQAHQAAVDASVDARAELLSRHRREWSAVRALAYSAIKSKGLEDARTAKTTAEALKVIQDAERKAWGLDTGEEGPVKVVVERRG